MRAFVAAAAALLVAAAVAGCGVTPPSSTPDQDDAQQMLQLKQSAGIADCPPAQTTDGGLPAKTIQCLGGGRPVDLSTLKGPVLINFWAYQCGPCREEMPALEAFDEKYGGRVPVVGIDTQDRLPKLALQTAQIRGVTYPLLADPDGTLQGSSLSVSKLPTTYVLTPDGTVKLLQIGGMTSADQVKELLASKAGITL